MTVRRLSLALILIATAGCGGGGGRSVQSEPPIPPSSLVLIERYYDNGRPKERGYVDSSTQQRYGAWQYWFDNGQLRWDGNYEADAIDGSLPWREYNRDGSVRQDWQDR